MAFRNSGRHIDLGLLLLRIGIGIMFMFHGAPKMFGGPEKWAKVGEAMTHLGIDFAPMFWGFMAGFAEFFGGIFLILGLFFLPACFLLLITMIVATISHLGSGDSLMESSHAIESGILFLSLLLIGPGKFSVDEHMK